MALVAVDARAAETRDAFAVDYTVIESDHFAAKFDVDHPVDIDDAERLLAALEQAFHRYHDDLGHRLPATADAFRINAYISGPTGTPDIPSYGGYMTFDADNAPILVFSHDLITSGDPGLRLVAAHEYHHAIQLTTGAFSAVDVDDTHDHVGWFFEASANWAAHVADPSDDVVFGDASTWVTNIEQSILLSSAVLAEDSPFIAHEYGAFLFPLCVSLDHGDNVVVRAWEEASDDDDPLDALARASGEDADVLLARCVARLATWDFPEPIRSHVAQWLPLTSSLSIEEGPITLDLQSNTTVDVGAVSGRPFRAWGAVLLRMPRNATRQRVRLSAAGFDGWLTVARSDVSAVAAGDADDGLDIEVPAGDGDVFLAVVAASVERDPAIGVALVATTSTADNEGGESPGPGGGCSTSSSSSLLALVFLLHAHTWRRRRR